MDVGLLAGVALTADGRAQAGMGVGAGDYDCDGWLDLVKTNFDDDTTTLYRNLGGRAFEDATFAGGFGVNTRFLGWGTGFLDFDRDGWPDLFIGQRPRLSAGRSHRRPLRLRPAKVLYRNQGAAQRGRRFEDVSRRAGPGLTGAADVARGRPRRSLQHRPADIVVNNMHGTPTLLHDCAPAAGQSLVLHLVGTRSNRSAIGARVASTLGGGSSWTRCAAAGASTPSTICACTSAWGRAACRAHRGGLAQRHTEVVTDVAAGQLSS